MFIYNIKSKNGSVGGSNKNYDEAMKEALSLVKIVFPKAILSEKLNDLVASPDYLVYENGEDKIFLEVKEEKNG